MDEQLRELLTEAEIKYNKALQNKTLGGACGAGGGWKAQAELDTASAILYTARVAAGVGVTKRASNGSYYILGVAE